MASLRPRRYPARVRRFVLSLAVLAVSSPAGCRDDAESKPAAKGDADPKGRCEDRIAALRTDLDALTRTAASRAQIGPATLAEGEGDDVTPTVVITVNEEGLAYGGRSLGGWASSDRVALVSALHLALVGLELDDVGLAIDRETPWVHVATAVDRLRAEGVTTVSLLFDGPEDPRFQNATLAKELRELPVEDQISHTWERLHALTTSCAPAREVFEALGEAGGGGVEEIVAKALPEALTQCGCAADVEAIGESTAVLLMPRHRLVGTSVVLGGPDGPPLLQPADARWSDVAKGVAANGTGRHWRVDGEVPAGLPPEPEPEPKPG